MRRCAAARGDVQRRSGPGHRAGRVPRERRQLFADAAARIGDVMRAMGAEMLAPLREALGEAMVLLEKARA